MTINDDEFAEIRRKLSDKKKKGLTLLPWRHGVAQSLKSTVQFIRQQSEDEFACITKINEDEFVTMPFSLYLKLLKSYQVDQSLDGEEG